MSCHNESMLIGVFGQRQFADERKWLFESADVRGGGTRDEPVRTSAWEANHLVECLIFRQKITLDELFSKIIKVPRCLIFREIARFENAALVRSRPDENRENLGPSTKPRARCEITQ